MFPFHCQFAGEPPVPNIGANVWLANMGRIPPSYASSPGDMPTASIQTPAPAGGVNAAEGKKPYWLL